MAQWVGAILAAVILSACGASNPQDRIVARPTATSACPHTLFSAALVTPSVGYVAGGDVPACSAFVLESRDGGRSFTHRASPSGVMEIVFSSVRDGWDFGGALYRTRDGAKSWQRQPMPGHVDGLAARGSTVMALVDQRQRLRCRQLLEISNDGGGAWARHALYGSTAVGQDVNEQVFLPDQAHGYVLVGARMWSTADSGRAWHPRHQPCGGREGAYTGPLLAGTGPQNLWLVCGLSPGTGNQGKLLYRSSTDGRTWRPIIGPRDFFARVRTPLPDAGYISALAATDARHSYLAEQRGTLLQTSDGGHHWKAAQLPTNHAAGLYDTGPDDVQFANPHHGWAITFNGAVYRTNDSGRHWNVHDPLG